MVFGESRILASPTARASRYIENFGRASRRVMVGTPHCCPRIRHSEMDCFNQTHTDRGASLRRRRSTKPELQMPPVNRSLPRPGSAGMLTLVPRLHSTPSRITYAAHACVIIKPAAHTRSRTTASTVYTPCRQASPRTNEEVVFVRRPLTQTFDRRRKRRRWDIMLVYRSNTNLNAIK